MEQQQAQQEFKGTIHLNVKYTKLGLFKRLRILFGAPIEIFLGINTENQAGNMKEAYNNLVVGHIFDNEPVRA